MSDLPNRLDDIAPHPDDANEIVIRNQRPGGLRIGLVYTGLACFWTGACGVLGTGVPARFPLLSGLVVVPLLVLSCILCGWALTRQPIRHWKLGFALSTWPGEAFSVSDICHFDIGCDPAEDYIEDRSPAPLCEVVAVHRVGRPVRILASVGDARRLRDWADRRGIPVRDPGGLLAVRGRSAHQE